MTFGTFFLPGPTEVRPEVLAAMTRPMIPHRGKAFEAVFADVQQGLQTVFQTDRRILISTSSALGLMEAAVRCAPAGKMLALVNGAFSERFARIAEASGRAVDRYTIPWGAAHTPDDLRELLRKEQYAVMSVVHSETSTGVLNPLADLVRVAHEFGTVCVIDSVSGIGGAEVQTDLWDLDFVLTGSQKALAVPPGLAFGAASAKFLAQSAEQERKGVYFDLNEIAAAAERGQTANTPAISLYYALQEQLLHISQETMLVRWARHHALAHQTYAWVDHLRETLSEEIAILAPASSRSPTVTTLTLPSSVTGPEVVRAVAERGITIGAGYGKLQPSTIRIGHMGDHTPGGLGRCLQACEEALRELLKR